MTIKALQSLNGALKNSPVSQFLSAQVQNANLPNMANHSYATSTANVDFTSASNASTPVMMNDMPVGENTFAQPFVPQDLWQMPMTLEWDWAGMTEFSGGGFEDQGAQGGLETNGVSSNLPTSGSFYQNNVGSTAAPR